MREAAGIVAPAVDVAEIRRQAHAAIIRVTDAERHEEKAEEQFAAAHQAREKCVEAARQARLEAGKALIALKRVTPHGKWLDTLRDLGLEQRTAHRYMEYAESAVGAKSDTPDTVSNLPSYTDSGVTKKREPKPDPVNDNTARVAAQTKDKAPEKQEERDRGIRVVTLELGRVDAECLIEAYRYLKDTADGDPLLEGAALIIKERLLAGLS